MNPYFLEILGADGKTVVRSESLKAKSIIEAFQDLYVPKGTDYEILVPDFPSSLYMGNVYWQVNAYQINICGVAFRINEILSVKQSVTYDVDKFGTFTHLAAAYRLLKVICPEGKVSTVLLTKDKYQLGFWESGKFFRIYARQ